MNELLDGGAEYAAEAESGGEPLGEGADVGTEEGVESVDEAVVRGELAVRDAHQSLSGS